MSIQEEQLMPKYVDNQKIIDGNYDKSLAVKCINGTFVGKKKDNVIAYKGIPFVGQQPVGSLRWKAPVDVTPNDGVYEAYHYGKSPMQAEGDPCSLYVMGEDCLYLNVWKAMRGMWVQFAKTGVPSEKWPLYDLKDKKVMVLDEFDIHPAKESEVKIVDWDRTYFLTKYYML